MPKTGRLQRHFCRYALSPFHAIDAKGPLHATISFSTEAASAEAIVRVEFWGDGKLLFSDLTSPYSFDWQAVPVGTHTLRAKAFNVQGTVATSKPATIVLTEPPAGERTASVTVH